MHYFLDSLILVCFFPGLDEVEVVLKKRSIHHAYDAFLLADGCNLEDICC